ncbi:MAG: SGNH/GDSL hydrolase family protein [Algoriphagus sp.]|nr:SGNH/GDSL hydrolase family protein [Algoriphagus sp.]
MAPYWFFQLRLIPWIPFLVYQAQQIRKTSPNLPSQSSLLTLGQGNKHILLLGESTVAGVGASSPAHTLAGNFHRLLGESYQIETIGKKGLRAKEALSLFYQHRQEQTRKFKGIILFLGANDCFLLTNPDAFKKELENLIHQIQLATSSQWIYLAAIPPVHLFPSFSKKMQFFLQMQRNYLQAELKKIAASHSKVIYQEIPINLQPEFFSADGVHPSDLGYQKIAELAFEKLNPTAVKINLSSA